MTCNTCGPLGRNITGRSIPGYPARAKNGTGGLAVYGVPRTDAERQTTHYARYGTTNLPPRGTGLGLNGAPTPKLITWDLGTLIVGVVAGVIIGAFIFTPSGREIGGAAGARAARRIRG